MKNYGLSQESIFSNEIALFCKCCRLIFCLSGTTFIQSLLDYGWKMVQTVQNVVLSVSNKNVIKKYFVN